MLAIWVLRVPLGLVFLTIGIAKVTGTLHTVQTFEAFGWGQWFRYASGLAGIIGALLVLLPQWTFYGALLLAGTVGLAAVLSRSQPVELIAALALTLLVLVLAWLARQVKRRWKIPRVNSMR